MVVAQQVDTIEEESRLLLATLKTKRQEQKNYQKQRQAEKGLVAQKPLNKGLRGFITINVATK